MFTSRKFYDAAMPGGGGPQTKVLTPELESELATLRTYKENFEKNSSKTPEDLAHEAEVERVNFRQYSVANNLMKDDDFSRIDADKSKSDRDVVYEDFSREWDSDNPEGKEDDRKAAFEMQYHLTSDNKTLKGRGEKLLKQQADALRSPLQSKYQSAKSTYDEEKMIRSEVPGFNAFIDEVVKENTPEKMVIKTKDGDEEIDIDVDLTKEQKEDISKTFRTKKAFSTFVTDKEKRAELKAAIAKKIQGYIRANNADRIAARAFEVGKGRGAAKSSSVGADQPFGLVKNNMTPKNAVNKNVMDEVWSSFDKVRDKV